MAWLAFQGFSHGRKPFSRSAIMWSVTRVYRSARLPAIEPFIVLLLSLGVTSRKKRAATELVRRLHGSRGPSAANGAGRSRTRGVRLQASRDSDHREKGAGG